jgi:phosphoribosylamine---glycine ligase
MNNTLVIGVGGRENAIVFALSRSSKVKNIFVVDANYGMLHCSSKVINVSNIDVNNYEEILNLINLHNINLTVIGPEAPLSNGIVDFLNKHNKKVFGPCREGATLESSKIFMKDVLTKSGVPTAKYQVFYSNQQQEAFDFINQFSTSNIVIKADGLAAGKGVVICGSLEEAKKTVIEFFDGKFGDASKSIVIEEFLDGFEVSLFGISDGENVICFKSACDHKRIFENDIGENTGGMGTFSPSFLTEEQEKNYTKTLIEPIVKELKSRGITYKGVLFAGLMICDGVAKVLEFNVRFGDPEAQSLLSRFESDFYDLCNHTINGTLNNYKPLFSNKTAVTVVLASKGYPQSSSKNDEIFLPQSLNNDEFIFHAGTKEENSKIFTNGGRVLGITALGTNKVEARKKAYNLVSSISFDGMQFRRDIAEDLISFTMQFEEEGWKTLGIGFYDFFQRLLRLSLKEHFAQRPSFLNNPNKLYEFSILLTNDEKIQELNANYRNKNKPTNVLSFPIVEEYKKDTILMGDIVLSLQMLQKESKEQSKPFVEHLAHLFVHSALHLIGYNHEEEGEMTEMENLEDAILNKIF